MDNRELIVYVSEGVIWVVMILCIAHISGKMDELCRTAAEILKKIEKTESNGRGYMSSLSSVRNVGDSWRCPDCGEENPLTQRICKGCGHQK